MSEPGDTYLIADLRAALRSVTADRDAARADAARYRDALRRSMAEMGTSTLSYHILRDALDAGRV